MQQQYVFIYILLLKKKYMCFLLLLYFFDKSFFLYLYTYAGEVVEGILACLAELLIWLWVLITVRISVGVEDRGREGKLPDVMQKLKEYWKKNVNLSRSLCMWFLDESYRNLDEVGNSIRFSIVHISCNTCNFLDGAFTFPAILATL